MTVATVQDSISFPKQQFYINDNISKCVWIFTFKLGVWVERTFGHVWPHPLPHSFDHNRERKFGALALKYTK